MSGLMSGYRLLCCEIIAQLASLILARSRAASISSLELLALDKHFCIWLCTLDIEYIKYILAYSRDKWQYHF